MVALVAPFPCLLVFFPSSPCLHPTPNLGYYSSRSTLGPLCSAQLDIPHAFRLGLMPHVAVRARVHGTPGPRLDTRRPDGSHRSLDCWTLGHCSRRTTHHSASYWTQTLFTHVLAVTHFLDCALAFLHFTLASSYQTPLVVPNHSASPGPFTPRPSIFWAQTVYSFSPMGVSQTPRHWFSAQVARPVWTPRTPGHTHAHFCPAQDTHGCSVVRWTAHALIRANAQVARIYILLPHRTPASRLFSGRRRSRSLWFRSFAKTALFCTPSCARPFLFICIVLLPRSSCGSAIGSDLSFLRHLMPTMRTARKFGTLMRLFGPLRGRWAPPPRTLYRATRRGLCRSPPGWTLTFSCRTQGTPPAQFAQTHPVYHSHAAGRCLCVLVASCLARFRLFPVFFAWTPSFADCLLDRWRFHAITPAVLLVHPGYSHSPFATPLHFTYLVWVAVLHSFANTSWMAGLSRGCTSV